MNNNTFSIGIVILLLLTFFGFGLVVPSYQYQVDIVIDQPKETSFSYFRHYDFMGEWVEGFEDVNVLEGDGYSEGSVNELYFIEDGKEKVAIETIVLHEDPDRVEIQIAYDRYVDDVEVVFKERNNHTRITAIHTISGTNVFWKTIYFFKKGKMIAKSFLELETLKRLIED